MNLDFGKKVVDSFSWNNSKFVEDNVNEVRINGRLYFAVGRLQLVTFSGVKYCVDTTSNEPNKYFLTVGMMTQHPTEIKNNPEHALEVASARAFVNPIITMEVSKDFDTENFVRIIREYYLATVHKNLKFVKTAKELKNKTVFD